MERKRQKPSADTWLGSGRARSRAGGGIRRGPERVAEALCLLAVGGATGRRSRIGVVEPDRDNIAMNRMEGARDLSSLCGERK